jgi:hypothetical protein
MLSRSFFERFALSVLAFLALSFSAFAQQDAGQIQGVVRDSAGAVIGGATVTIRSEALGVERTVTTNESGAYVAPQLRPGAYTVTVTQTGFTTAQADVEVGLSQNRAVDLQLEIGQSSEVVNVTANLEAATVDASSNRLGVNVTAREVKELPVNGRNYSQLQLLTPGATNTGVGNFNDIRFNGRSNQQNQTRLDGIENTAIFDASPGYLTVQGSQFRLQTSLENIQEFRVESSNYPAEFGTGTGGQVNVVGKSGSNDFHGSLFYYGRNDKFDARNFFDGANKSPLRLNQFGGSFGGRLIKDRLFFFGSYEGLRQRAGFNIIEATPSTTARDFVNFFGTSDPRGDAAAAALGITFANPTDRSNAVARVAQLRALGVINAFPVGTGAAFAGGGFAGSAPALQSVLFNQNSKLDENSFSVRFDGKISDRLNGYVRYQRATGDLAAPDGVSGRFLAARQEADNLVASVTQIYGARFVNETKFGYNRPLAGLRTQFPSVAGSTVDFSRTLFNISGAIVNPGVNGGASTGIVSPGGLTRQSSAGNGRSQPVDPRSFSFIDNLSVSLGAHTLKFGGEARINQVNFDQLGGFQFTYGNLRDFLLNQNVTASFIGDLSLPGDFQIATNPVTTVTRPRGGMSEARQYYLIGYGQDEWRIRPNVTINYGLRYEFYSAVNEANDRAVIFDVGAGRLLDPRTTDFYRASKKNFAPRLGITYSPTLSFLPDALKGKTVIRAGGGLFYGPGQFEDLIQPIESDVFRSGQNFASLDANSVSRVSSTTLPVTNFQPRAFDRAYRVPERVGQFGVSIQQELPGNTVLTIAYVGSQGRNLFLRSITNQILPGQTTILDGTAIPGGFGIVNRVNAAGRVVGVTTVRQFSLLNMRTNPTTGVPEANVGTIVNPFGEIDFKTSGGTDSYNALQIAVNRRFTKGLTLGGQYTYGHSIGNTQGANEAQTAQDPNNFAAERGNNTFDIRHSVNLTALYELPLGKGRKFDLDGLADKFLGGFQVGGVFNARSGTPLDIRITRPDVVIMNPTTGVVGALPATVNAANPLPAGFIAVVNTPGGNASRNTRRPDIVPGVDPFLNGGNELLFLNPAAFTTPRPGTFGNLARNALFGPRFFQFDFTVQKRIALTERMNLEFRTEIYNLFNRANFANPPATLPSVLGTIAADGTTSSPQPGQSFSTLNAGVFGNINSTVGRTVGLGTNRQIQFSLRFNF